MAGRNRTAVARIGDAGAVMNPNQRAGITDPGYNASSFGASRYVLVIRTWSHEKADRMRAEFFGGPR